MRACAGGLYSRCTTRAPESSLSLSSLFLSFSPSPHPDDCRLYSARLRKCIYTRSFSSACYVCMYVCVCAGEPHIQFSRRGNHNHRLRASGARVSATWPSRHGDSFLFSFSLSLCTLLLLLHLFPFSYTPRRSERVAVSRRQYFSSSFFLSLERASPCSRPFSPAISLSLRE